VSGLIRSHVHPHRRLAFTLVEAVISTIIVSVMLVAALSTAGASRLIQYKVSLSNHGRLLAEQLLAEVVQHDYQDANESIVFGPEADESAATRADFDDVDDYNGWSAGPPVAKEGAELANVTGWQRTVTVQWVDPLDTTQVEASETGAKRITVTASHNNMPQATLVCIRTAHQ